MTLIAMQVCCDCSHPEVVGMDPEGVFDSDNDKARCYCWVCPVCERRTMVRMNPTADEEE